MKNNIYCWIWKWHFIGGIIAASIVIILSITGIIYLFKDNYEASYKEAVKKVTPAGKRISYQQQWDIAKKEWGRVPSGMVIPPSNNEATEFISGKFSHKSSVFVDPYSGKINGSIIVNQTDMHSVRKLHGELLMGSFGTRIVELVASWMVVLIISGLFLFWPRERGIKSLFTVRTNSKQVLYRDLHGITGFWCSLILLLILAGGLPWTDVFGSSFKWVQDQTHTGYPSTWEGKAFKSEGGKASIPLDEIIQKAKSLDLEGTISIDLPATRADVYSIYNEPLDLHDTRKIHIDQYTGEILKMHTWDDIGILMKARIWAMAFHQGEMGRWNRLLVLITAFGLLALSVFGIVSYLLRKRKGSWSVPNVPEGVRPGIGIVFVMGVLGIVLPLFGASVIAIFIIEKIRNSRLAHTKDDHK